EFLRGRCVVEGAHTSENLAPVVARKPNRRERSGPPAEVDLVRSADIQAAVGKPNRIFGERREVIEEIRAERDDMVRLTACLRDIMRDLHVETIAIDSSVRVTRGGRRRMRPAGHDDSRIYPAR